MHYAEKFKRFMRQEDVLVGNLFLAIHAIVWGQCSEAMKTSIKTLSDYQERSDANDCMWLLQKIRPSLWNWTKRNTRRCPYVT